MATQECVCQLFDWLFRIQELRADEQMAQNIQDGEMTAMLQEKEDKQLANQMTETALAEESTVNLARSLSKPAVDSTSQFTRTGSGSMVHTQNQSQMSRSRTFGFKTVSPVLNQKPRPPVAKKSNNYVQSVMEPVREIRPIGLVPQVGHPFLQTPEDQQLFKEREKSLDGQSNPSVSVRPDPPSYSQINQSNLSLQSEPPASDQSDSLPVPQVPANYLPVSDQSAVELQEEPTPLPPPPFSGVSPSKLRHNKKRK